MKFIISKVFIFLIPTILIFTCCTTRPFQKNTYIEYNQKFIYLDSFTQVHIQAAADSLKEKGGVIVLPEGSVQIIGSIRIFGGISIIGQGNGKTIFYRGETTPNDPIKAMIEVNGENTGRVRIQGIRFEGYSIENNDFKDSGIKLNNVQEFRISYCQFEKFGNSGIVVNNTSWGVIDHCVFKNIFKKSINNLGYGVCIYGAESWNDAIQPGSKFATFIEDCDFYGCRHAVASNKSARYVFRHNYVAENIVSHSVDAHGPGFGSSIGTQWVEIYNNLIENNLENREAIMIRGGAAIIYNNIINDHREAIVLTLDFDNKIDWTKPYPLPWQVQNTWQWNNTHNGKAAQVFIPIRSENYIKENRDYFNSQKTNYKSYTYPHPLTDEKNWNNFSQFNPY